MIYGGNMKYETKLQDLAKRAKPSLHNGGLIVHERDETEAERERLHRDYPEAEGYRHIEFRQSAEDPNMLDICITDVKRL